MQFGFEENIMRGINKVILVGTLGRDPESKSFASGGTVCNFSIATSEQWNDKNTGERREATEWHRIVANGRLAEICQQYLKKGSQVYIEGSLRTREWEDQGQKRYITEIRANEMQMLGGRPSGQGSAEGDYAPFESSRPAAATAPRTNYAAPASPAAAPAPSSKPAFNDLDDDLPF